jgi:hypothetical protein
MELTLQQPEDDSTADNMSNDVRSEVSTVVTMKKTVFWVAAPCSSCVNRRFGGSYRK